MAHSFPGKVSGVFKPRNSSTDKLMMMAAPHNQPVAAIGLSEKVFIS
ncbi:hypothetical protein L7750_17520 [Xenorhabdus bovienii]|nr:hypothetical protein [Xenorhabdus bovienii]MCG3472112.1 hypothetical protein [Xenorhabdus bovienii]